MTDQAMLSRWLAHAMAEEAEDKPLTWRAGHAVREILGADGASITIENPTLSRVTLCATDSRAASLENLQDVLGEGPCRDAYDSGRPVETPVSGAAARWPQFAAAAEKIIGPDGVLWSIPMQSAGEVIGTISLYRLVPGPLAMPIEAASVLAEAVAAQLLQDPLAFAPFTDPAADSGWSSRALVHQAAGMLMGQLRTSMGDAMALLRSYAFATDMYLTDVARDVLDRKLNLSGD
jgi:ANTAR domain/GAF domain